jgi:hypothetical protein
MNDNSLIWIILILAGHFVAAVGWLIHKIMSAKPTGKSDSDDEKTPI